MILELLGQGSVLLGGAIFLAAAVGLHRLPDPYMRASSVATAAGLGIAFVVAGTALMAPEVSTLIKATIAIFLQLATSAVGSMAIARAAVLSGHRFSAGTDPGELSDHPGHE